MPRCCFDRRLDDGLSMLSRRFDPRKMFRLEGIWVETEFRALPGTLGGNSLQTASTIESILDDRVSAGFRCLVDDPGEPIDGTVRAIANHLGRPTASAAPAAGNGNIAAPLTALTWATSTGGQRTGQAVAKQGRGATATMCGSAGPTTELPAAKILLPPDDLRR
uniref:Uncharacterized protein n=1 Tax=Anopheles merus TaxID=30066 RepID=A0A182V8H3_ANOME